MRKIQMTASMKDKKGQAAMEFLMTYGWAILAAVIVVGVLWYLIGNPANLAGNNFQLSAPFASNAMSLDSSGVLSLEFRNGESVLVTVTNVSFGTGSTCPYNETSFDVSSGQLGTSITTCTGSSGDRINSDVTISYTKSGSSLTQSATGSISGTMP